MVELLVTITIIGLLLALLLPALSKGKGRAQRIQCVSNLHQLGVGLQVLLANNHGYPVIYASTNEGYSDFDKTWVAQLEREGLGISTPETNYYQKGVWSCPNARWSARTLQAFPPICYGYNTSGILPSRATNEFGLQGHFDARLRSWTPIMESAVAVPTDMIALGDCYDGSIEFTRAKWATLNDFGNMLTRHQAKANVVFCDGHVESPTLKLLLEDTSDAALARWNRDHLPHRDRL